MVLCLVAQSCPTLCSPMDYSQPGSSVNEDSPGKNTGVGCHALLQGIFPTQESNPCLPPCRQILYHLSHQGSPRILEWVTYCSPGYLPHWGIVYVCMYIYVCMCVYIYIHTAKSLQLCLTLWDPVDGSPPGSTIPGILQTRTLECLFFSNAWKWKVKVKLLSCPTLSNPMDCSPPGSSVHGIFQARILGWGAISFSTGSSRPRSPAL